MPDFRAELGQIETGLSAILKEVETVPVEFLAKLFFMKAVELDAKSVTDTINAARDNRRNHVSEDDVRAAAADTKTPTPAPAVAKSDAKPAEMPSAKVSEPAKAPEPNPVAPMKPADSGRGDVK